MFDYLLNRDLGGYSHAKASDDDFSSCAEQRIRKFNYDSYEDTLTGCDRYEGVYPRRETGKSMPSRGCGTGDVYPQAPRCTKVPVVALQIINAGGYVPEIKRVIFNKPATIVFWEDGDKTVVRCQKEDIKNYSEMTGLAMAIAKKALGNEGKYFDLFKKYCKMPQPKTKKTDSSKKSNDVSEKHITSTLPKTKKTSSQKKPNDVSEKHATTSTSGTKKANSPKEPKKETVKKSDKTAN